ncbi:DNA repair protein rad52 [Actinomortierella wolfii]|nr:DNA repair protein rad52 [Actinomortierella wolfii]
MIKHETDAGHDMRLRVQQPAIPGEAADDNMNHHVSNVRQMRQAFLQELLQPPKTEFTPDETAFLDEQLPKYLSAEYTSTRQGPGRTTLTYVEAWRIKNVANRLFGFNGWSSTVSDVTIDFTDIAPDGRIFIGVSAVVRVTLKDGTCHEDLGFGSSENLKSKAASFEKAKKEAVTDALKRALTSFGNVLGACLYDKHYCKEISQFKPLKRSIHESEYYNDASPSIPRPGSTTSRATPTSAASNIASAGPSTARSTTTTSATTTLAPRGGPSMLPTPLRPTTLNPPMNSSSAKPSVQNLSTVNNTIAANGSSHNAISRPPQSTATTATTSAPVSAPAPAAAQPLQQTLSNDAERQFETDDFLPADPIEEERAFIPESPRMSDLDIDMDLLPDDSPVQVKQELISPWATTSSGFGGGAPRQQNTTLPLRASSASPKDLPSVARQLLSNFRYTGAGRASSSSTNATTTATTESISTSTSSTEVGSGAAYSSTPTRRPFSRVSSSPSLSSPSRKDKTVNATTGAPPPKPQLLQFQPIRNDLIAAATSSIKATTGTSATSTADSKATTSKDPTGLASFQPRARIVSPYVTGQPLSSRLTNAEGGAGSRLGTAQLDASSAGVNTAGGARADPNSGNPFKVVSSNHLNVSRSDLASSSNTHATASSADSSQGSLNGSLTSSSSSITSARAAANPKHGQKRPLGADGGIGLANKEARLH